MRASRGAVRALSSTTRSAALQRLGCTEASSREAIRDAYYRLAKACHPDQGGSAAEFRALAAAYADKAHAALAASRLRAAAGLVAAAADACERARAAAAAVDPSLPPPPPGAPPLHALTAPYDPDAAHFAALRAAMRDAVALVADHEPDGGGGFSVYAAGAAG